MTCTPLGINTHRILVTGERVIPTPLADLDAAGEGGAGPGFPWWAVMGGGVLTLAGGYVWIAGRPRRDRVPVPAPTTDATLSPAPPA